MMKRLILMILTSSSVLLANEASFAKKTVNAIESNQVDDYFQLFCTELSNEVENLPAQLSAPQLDDIDNKLTQYKFLALANEFCSEQNETLFKWLAKKPSARKLFVKNIKAEDDVLKVCEILTDIMKKATKDPDLRRGISSRFNLALATALVFDKPVQKLHQYTGTNENIKTIPAYDIYKFLSKRQSAYTINGSSRPIQQLIHIVHLPVSTNTLNYCQVSSNLSQMKSQFIQRDRTEGQIRGLLGKVSWPKAYGEYSLLNIIKYGGNEFDASYFDVILRRLSGEPQLLVNTTYSNRQDALSVSYSANGVSTSGTCASSFLNPQTNKLTDYRTHLLEKEFLYKKSYSNSNTYLNLAKFIHDYIDKSQLVKLYSDLALKTEPLNVYAWDYAEELLDKSYFSNVDGSLTLSAERSALKLLKDNRYNSFYERKRREFKRHKVIVEQTYIDFFKKLYLCVNDEKISVKSRDLVQSNLAKFYRSMKKKPSVYSELTEIYAEFLTERGKVAKALEAFEESIKNEDDMGCLIFDQLEQYVELAKENDRQISAAKFMKKLHPKMEKTFNLRYHKVWRFVLMDIVESAYENAGDYKMLNKLHKSREELLLNNEKIVEELQKHTDKQNKKKERRRKKS